MLTDEYLNKITERFSKLPEVESIVLAGSYATNTTDSTSDYDVYIYTSSEIPLETRKEIYRDTCSYMEVDNKFWETEDDGILNNGIPVEIIYRGFDWIEGMLKRVVIECQSDVGYTTCFWSNIVNSIVLYDKNNRYTEMKKRYSISYPENLRKNIVSKNFPLLRGKIPSYYGQIEKALSRDDMISVNHRVSALLASYFDILFAVNMMKHPGEKKLVKILTEKASLLPKNMAENLEDVIQYIPDGSGKLLHRLDILLDNLDVLLKKEGLI